MATTVDYMEFVCERLAGVGALRYRKMFGEYMVYVNDRPLLLVCDNTVFVKLLPELSALMAGAETALPYAGGKPHYILDIEDRTLTEAVLAVLAAAAPAPKAGGKQRKKQPDSAKRNARRNGETHETDSE